MADLDEQGADGRTDFDDYADNYHAVVRHSQAFVPQRPEYFIEVKARHLIELARTQLGPVAELRFLDVGCGVGSLDRHLVRQVGELHGVDIAAAALERAARENPDVRYQAYDGKTLPFDDGALDLACAVNVFHHVSPGDRSSLIAEMARVTRPGGLVVVYEHNPLNPLTRLAVYRCEFDGDAVLLGRGSVVRLMGAADLEPVVRQYILFLPFGAERMARVERLFGWLPLGAQHCVAGRKR